MTPSCLPYPWKIVVSAATIAVLMVVVLETRKHWPSGVIAAIPEPNANEPLGHYADALARVQEIIATHTASVPEVVSPGMSLVDLGIDSLTRADVADALETTFRIELSSEELAAAVTVDDLVQLVVKKQPPALDARSP